MVMFIYLTIYLKTKTQIKKLTFLSLSHSMMIIHHSSLKETFFQ